MTSIQIQTLLFPYQMKIPRLIVYNLSEKQSLDLFLALLKPRFIEIRHRRFKHHNHHGVIVFK